MADPSRTRGRWVPELGEYLYEEWQNGTELVEAVEYAMWRPGIDPAEADATMVLLLTKEQRRQLNWRCRDMCDWTVKKLRKFDFYRLTDRAMQEIIDRVKPKNTHIESTTIVMEGQPDSHAMERLGECREWRIHYGRRILEKSKKRCRLCRDWKGGVRPDCERCNVTCDPDWICDQQQSTNAPPSKEEDTEEEESDDDSSLSN